MFPLLRIGKDQAVRRLLLPAAVLVFFERAPLCPADHRVAGRAAGQARPSPGQMPVEVGADHPNIRYLGRWDTTDTAAPGVVALQLSDVEIPGHSN